MPVYGEVTCNILQESIFFLKWMNECMVSRWMGELTHGWIDVWMVNKWKGDAGWVKGLMDTWINQLMEGGRMHG